MEFAHASKQQRLLPDLSGNVVRANSLIGPDYLRGQATFDGPADETDASPAAFEDLFPDVMRRGGFDAIVGNPPYVRIQGFPGKQVSYLREHYSAATGSFDIYVCFVEKALSLLRKSGGVGYILPNKFFTTDYGEGLRRILSAERALRAVVNFGVSQVFKATTYTCLLFLSKDRSAVVDYADAVADPNALAHLAWLPKSADSFAGEPWDFADDDSKDLLRKAATSGVRLLDLPASMSRGSSTGADDVFIVPHSADLEPGVLRTPVFAADFSRYAFEPTGEWRVIFPYEVYASGAEVFSEGQLRQRAPKVFSYLREHQAALKKRKQFREVHGFSAPRNLALHDRAAIAVPLLANGGLCALIPSEMHGTLCPMASGGFTIALGDGAPVSAEYVVGLLNSKLLYWMLMRTSNVFRGGWLTCTKQYFGELPIKLPLESEEVEVVRLVRDAVSARRKLRASRSDRDKDTHQRRCTSIDRELDECVYRLYALTPAEVALVERAVDVRGTPDDRASES